MITLLRKEVYKLPKKTKSFFNARDDKVFKAIFADPADTFLLETLLNLIFNTKVKNIKFENSELLKRNVIERAKICDFVAYIDDKLCHIELNSQYQKWLHLRNFNFFTTSIDKQTEVGEMYNIKNYYIHIDLTYNLPNSENLDYVLVYTLETNKHLKYVNNVYFVEFNMDKIKKVWYDVINERERKLYYYLSRLDMSKKELEVEEEDEFVKKLKEKLNKLNQNKEFVSFLSREKDIEFQMNTERSEGIDEGINIGFSQGISQGINIGKNESKTEIAKNMLVAEESIEKIMTFTGLSLKEIEGLK